MKVHGVRQKPGSQFEIQEKDFYLFELSCTIIATFNEERPIWPSYFMENYDSLVGHIMDYSFAFC